MLIRVLSLDYGFCKSRRLRKDATIFLLQRSNCFCNEYEYIEMFSSKYVIYDGCEGFWPQYGCANGWQSKKWHFEGNKMIKTQDGRRKIVTVWEFDDNQVVQTFSVDNIVARKFYERTHSSASAAYSFCEQYCVE